MINILNEILSAKKSGKEFVLATIVKGFDGSPGRSGFKLLIFADNTNYGTLGGGELEFRSIKIAKNIFKTGRNVLEKFELTKEKMNMGCGGKVEIFFEYFPVTKKVYMFGCGHLCKSLSPLLASIGFYLVGVDNRKEFATKKNIRELDEIICMDYLKFLQKFKPKKNDAILIFTHGHSHDYEILEEICRKKVDTKYLGLIGSKQKIVEFIKKIKSQDMHEVVDKLYSPVGLNVAKTTTNEIAIAIAAEILAVYNGVEKIRHSREKLSKICS